MRITQKRSVRRIVKKKNRISQFGGMLLKLPYYQYIRLDTRTSRFESIICGITSIDIHTDILSVCGLDTQYRVWFGTQKMDHVFYETYMNNVGYEHQDVLVLRKYVLEGIAQPDTIIRGITDTTVTLTISHWNLNIISDCTLEWAPIYTGKELYHMIAAQISPPSSSSQLKSPTTVSSSKNTNTLAKMVFPSRRQTQSKNRMRKKQKTSIEIDKFILSDDLENIHGIGEKTKETLHTKNIHSIKELREAIIHQPTLLNHAQRLGLQYYDDLKHPIPREEIKQYETRLQQITTSLEPSMKLTIAGSYRRNQPRSHDIDVLFMLPETAEFNGHEWLDRFVAQLIEEGFHIVYLTRTSSKRLAIIQMSETQLNRRIDFMVVPYSTYPFALLYLTGPKEFTVYMREQAITKGYSLSEHGFKYLETNERVDVNMFRTEKDIFEFIGVPYQEPELRKVK
jgi:DNA polymerase/3'-5' exonuclease PolX